MAIVGVLVLLVLGLLIFFLLRNRSSDQDPQKLYVGERPPETLWQEFDLPSPTPEPEEPRVEVYDLAYYDFDPHPHISEKVESEVRKILEKLPVPRVIVAQIYQLFEDPRSSPSKIARFISADPVLTGEILRIANSAYYRTAAAPKITSVNRAIVLIGYNHLRMILLHYFLLRTVTEHTPLSPKEIEDLRKHALQVSAIMGYIALQKGYDTGLYLTAGILHDVGKFFLPLFGEKGTVSGLQEGPPLQEEEMLYGFTHTSLGAYITRFWELPEEMQAATAYHHPRLRSDLWDLPPAHRTLLGWLIVADYLSHLYGDLRASYAYKVPSWVLEGLKLSSPEDLLTPELLGHLKRASVIEGP